MHMGWLMHSNTLPGAALPVPAAAHSGSSKRERGAAPAAARALPDMQEHARCPADCQHSVTVTRQCCLRNACTGESCGHVRPNARHRGPGAHASAWLLRLNSTNAKPLATPVARLTGMCASVTAPNVSNTFFSSSLLRKPCGVLHQTTFGTSCRTAFEQKLDRTWGGGILEVYWQQRHSTLRSRYSRDHQLGPLRASCGWATGGRGAAAAPLGRAPA